jgi:alpha-N-arabinofuranosidase
VINRHKENSISTDILSQTGVFDGNFEVYEVNGPDTKADNDFGKTLVETRQKPAIKVNKSDKFSYSFPAHSFTMIKGKISE